MALHRRIYGLLLRAYPRELRDDVGAEMMAMFCERWREERARRGARGLATLWLRTLADVARNAPAEWLRRRRQGGSSMDALLQDVMPLT